jgi:hypothetical protein
MALTAPISGTRKTLESCSVNPVVGWGERLSTYSRDEVSGRRTNTGPSIRACVLVENIRRGGTHQECAMGQFLHMKYLTNSLQK